MKNKISVLILIAGVLFILGSANTSYSQNRHHSGNHSITNHGFPYSSYGYHDNDNRKKEYNNHHRRHERRERHDYDNDRHRRNDHDRDDWNYHNRCRHHSMHHSRHHDKD